MFAKRISSTAQFDPDKMGKSTLMRGDLLFVGLNAFEPGSPGTAASKVELLRLMDQLCTMRTWVIDAKWRGYC